MLRQLQPCRAEGRSAINIPLRRPLRSATHARARAEAGTLAVGNTVIRERPCMSCPQRLPALVVQPSDTTCSLQRPPTLVHSALPSREALWCHTLRDPEAMLGRRPGIPIAPIRLTSRCSRSTRSRPTRRTICGSRAMGYPSPPHRPPHCRWCRPLTSGIWSSLTCGAMWQA